jgi:polyisoprenoid-binding protein YceI
VKENPNMKRSLSVLAVLGLLASPALADTWVVDPVHSNASFQVRHIVTKVRGQFKDLAGTIEMDAQKPESSKVEFVIKAASIDTGNERRDAHLRSQDFFFVEKYPELTFKSTAIKPTGKDQFAVTGILTMHGVAKQITLPVSFLGAAGDKAGFSTAITLNRKDYEIVWNKALDEGGYMLGDDVEVTIDIEASRKKPEAAK